MINEMQDSDVKWIGEVPKNWNIGRLKIALMRKKELVERYNNESILSLTINGVIERDLINITGKMPTSFDGYQIIERGNLLTCLFDIDVTPRCVGISKINGLTSPAYTQFKVKENYNTEFIYYYLLMLDNDKTLVAITKSLRNTIKSDDFLNLKFPFPSLKEQEKIAKFIQSKISNIEQLIYETNKSITELKAYKQSLISEVVTEGLDKHFEMKDSGINWIDEIPKEWSIIKLKRLFYINKIIAGNNDYQVLSVTQSGLKIKDVTVNEGQMSADYSKYQIVDKNDFVMNHMDLLTGWIDISKFVGVTSPDYRVFKSKDSKLVFNRYFLYIFQLLYKNKIFYSMARGVSNIGRWRLQTNSFLNTYLPLPSYEDQVNIVSFLDTEINKIDCLINFKYEIIKEYESYKKSLIYEYVTGKRNVEEDV